MAKADKKQLGTLYLDIETVRSNIKEVNKMLADLGTHANLDLTKLVNAKVNSQLNDMKRQIETIGKAASSSTKATTDEIKKATQLLKEQIQLTAKLSNTSGTNARGEQVSQIQARLKAFNELSLEARAAAQSTEQVAKAQEQLNLAMAKSEDRRVVENVRSYNSALKERIALEKEQNQYASRIANQMVTRAGQALVNALRNQWSSMIDYATEYYDTLNEIRVVTGMTEAAADKVGAQYRQLAKEMKVTSAEQASAAVTFYRQGLNDDQVGERLKWATEYAKVANIDFNTAAELITASANAMSADIQGNIERVVDVFLYLGDAAATSGEEIGKAMQKASASATEFGLSFEWLGSYIATVAEQTRQAPQTIGNAFNTMLARLHSIKERGFNEEDETRINDVAKALAQVNIALTDSEGNWRDMSEIYTDIAVKWNDMSDKQKSYIATTVAGVRQQNVFFALMNDMSKGLEGGSRALQLYAGAMSAAGTATEKYAVWQESVAASQENLKRSWEELYSVLSGGTLKTAYDLLAGVVDVLAAGTQWAHGWNLALIPVVATIVSLGMAQNKAGDAATQLHNILSAMKNHPIIAGLSLAVTLVGALTAGFGLLAKATQQVPVSEFDYEKTSQNLKNALDRIQVLQTQQKTMNDLWEATSGGMKGTNQQLSDFNDMLGDVSSISPIAKAAVDDFNAGLKTQEEILVILNAEFAKLLEQQQSYRKAEAMKMLSGYSRPEDMPADVNYSLIDSRYIKKNTSPAQVISAIESDLRRDINREDMPWLQAYYDAVKGMKEFDMDNFVQASKDYVNEQQHKIESMVEDEMGKIVGWIMMTIDEEQDSVQVGYVQSRQMSLLMGDDHIDYNDISPYHVHAVWGMQSDVVEEALSGDRSADYLVGIFRQLFGDAADTWMPLTEDPALVESMSKAYEALLAAGFRNIDIAKIFSQEDGSWEDIVGNAQTYALKDVQIGDEFFEVLVGMDTETQALTLRLLSMGYAIEDLQDVWSSTDTLDEFVESLREMNATAKEAAEIQPEIPEPVDYLKNMADAMAEIDRIQEILTNLKAGKAVGIQDMFGLLTSYPELQKYLGNTEQLIAQLEEVQKQAQSSYRGTIAEFVANSAEALQMSPWNWTAQSSGIQTLQELIDFARDNNNMTLVANVQSYLYNMIQALWSLEEAAQDSAAGFGELGKAIEEQSFDDKTKQAKSELTKLESIIQHIKDGQGVGVEDMMWITKAHPELQDYLGDIDLQIGKLDEVRQAYEASYRNTFIESMLNDQEILQMSSWANLASQSGITTLQGLLDLPSASEEQRQGILAWVNLLADAFFQLAEAAEEAEEPLTDLAQIQKQYEKIEQIQNAINAINPQSSGYSPAKSAEAYEYLNAEYTSLQYYDRSTEQGRLRYAEEASNMLHRQTQQTNAQAAAMGIVSQATADATQRNQEHIESLRQLYEELSRNVEVAKAQRSGFAEQITDIEQGFTNGGIEWALNRWNSFSDEMKSAIRSEFPQLVSALTQIELRMGSTAERTETLRKALSSTKFATSARYFNNTAKAIVSLENYTTNATDAMVAFYTEAENAVKAQDEYRGASQKMAQGVSVAAEDVQNLAAFLGYVNPDAQLRSWDQVGPMISDAQAEGEEALRRLQEAAFINITGSSSADFSNLMNGLLAVEDEADKTVQMLLATGQFELEEKQVNEEFPLWMLSGGKVVRQDQSAPATFRFLKPTGSNPFKSNWSPSSGGNRDTGTSSGGGGGGGGGGGNQKSGPTEVELMLDRMAQIQALQNHTRSLYSGQADYYSQTGELQGVIRYYEKEIVAIKAQNQTLESNVSELETWIEKKRAEVDSLDKSSEEYATAADELKQLQDRHQEYSLAQIANRTEIDKQTKSIKEQQDAIRQMEINLRNTILQAIRDREELNDRMLQGVVEVENTILDLIQMRYEKERDLILESAQAQIDALQEERDLQSEQLELRKQQAEEEDKAAKLAEMEAKYARIAADPTRRKEMLAIEQEINDLRDEMAWDLAEKEVKAQQDAIDEQITSIEDYKEYIEQYYEDMFEHPKKLIAEMKEIIAGTDEEIVAWLISNSDEYADRTEAAQAQMVNGWQQMLDDMRGAITVYWEEVESIIALGDEGIIAFLKDNSADYREAGKLQAEAYVDEWRKQLEDLHVAYRQVTDEIQSYNYAVVEQGTGSGTSGGGGSGGGSYSSSATAKSAGKSAGLGGLLSISDITGLSLNAGNGPINTTKELVDLGNTYKDLNTLRTIVKQSAADTVVRIPPMPTFGDSTNTTENSAINVGDIIVNVDQMDSDADYEEMADKVMSVMMERLNRGSPVGGLRLTR